MYGMIGMGIAIGTTLAAPPADGVGLAGLIVLGSPSAAASVR
jgi:hypothetical protein